jgi:hypothetical protein
LDWEVDELDAHPTKASPKDFCGNMQLSILLLLSTYFEMLRRMSKQEIFISNSTTAYV